jgi:hypothetical protein
MDFFWTGLLILAIVCALSPRNAVSCEATLPLIKRAAAAAFVVSSSLALVWMSFSLWLMRRHHRRGIMLRLV